MTTLITTVFNATQCVVKISYMFTVTMEMLIFKIKVDFQNKRELFFHHLLLRVKFFVLFFYIFLLQIFQAGN